jgi:hypothetical protein
VMKVSDEKADDLSHAVLGCYLGALAEHLRHYPHAWQNWDSVA